MNRIRKVNNSFQVLITPNIKVAPDSPILVGNWEDENLRNYYVLEFDSMNGAQAEAFKYPDIDWYRFTLNHEPIFKNLNSIIRSVINDYGFNVDIKPHLMSPEELKFTMFDRVLLGGERFNTRSGFNDIISFTIISPWTNVLHKVSRVLENYKYHMFRDDLRIREKQILDGKIISLIGYTEFGTTYEIRLMPTILFQWAEWRKKRGVNQENAEQIYKKLVKNQDMIDNGPVLM